jgi:hypothetical protein
MTEGNHIRFTSRLNGTVLMRVQNKSAIDAAGRLYKKSRKALPIEDLSR